MQIHFITAAMLALAKLAVADVDYIVLTSNARSRCVLGGVYPTLFCGDDDFICFDYDPSLGLRQAYTITDTQLNEAACDGKFSRDSCTQQVTCYTTS